MAVGTNWSRVDPGVLTLQTYVGMVKSVVLLAEALGQGKQTHIASGKAESLLPPGQRVSDGKSYHQ